MLTVKNYNVRGGISYQMHTDNNDDYYVKCLMGMGLGLSPDGTHIAFTAGTGILVFVDLIALMIRVNLGLIDKQHCRLFARGSSFKFVLYASFPTKFDAAGLELVQGLRDITREKGLDNFELILRIKENDA